MIKLQNLFFYIVEEVVVWDCIEDCEATINDISENDLTILAREFKSVKDSGNFLSASKSILAN